MSIKQEAFPFKRFYIIILLLFSQQTILFWAEVEVWTMEQTGWNAISKMDGAYYCYCTYVLYIFLILGFPMAGSY